MTPATSSPTHTESILWALPMCHMDWERTPPAVLNYIRTPRERVSQLEKQVETLQGRGEKTSQTSSTPPSSDSPCQKPNRQRQKSRGTRGYTRFCRLMDRYYDRQDEAGRLVRHLQREMASLWVLLCEHGVEPTNNRGERALRFAVIGRKSSHGTASAKPLEI